MPKGRLLVADRNPEFLEKTHEILDSAGYEMVAHTEGDRVLHEIKQRQIDGVIANYMLAGLDGTALCRELRAHDERVPCYLMIPSDDDELREQCLEAGARNVLVRPLKRTELLFAARSMMNLRSLLRERGPTEGGAPERRAPPPPPSEGNADSRASFFHFEMFKRLLAIELKRAKRYDFPLALLLVAPDGEAAVPIVGDGDGSPIAGVDSDAATIMGRAVAQAVRDIDIPMHFADNTLMVVMPHTDGEGARVVAERIRRKARSGEGAITVSIGLTAMKGKDKPNYQQLVARASKALRAARRAGGDQVSDSQKG